MKYLPFIIILISLIGCGETLRKITRSQKLTEKTSEATKTNLDAQVGIKYPPQEHLVLTASGNARQTITIARPDHVVTANQDQTRSSTEKFDSSFSFDEFYESIPTWVFPTTILALCMLGMVYWWLSKTTAAGRALDQATAGALNFIDSRVRRMKDKLITMNPKSPEFNALKNELDDMTEERSQVRHQSPKKNGG